MLQFAAEQHRSVRSLVSEFPEIFTDVSGKTKLVEFAINLIEDKPFRMKPYPVPYAVQETMKVEVRKH